MQDGALLFIIMTDLNYVNFAKKDNPFCLSYVEHNQALQI
jgi:hypothetical protein